MAWTTRWPRSAACHLATATASAAVAAGVEPPGRLPQGDPHGLDVDGGVGGPQHGALEGAERAAELVALVEVGRRLAPAPTRPRPTCQGAQAGPGPRPASSPRASARRRRPATTSSGPTASPVEVQVGVDLAVGGHRPLEARPRRPPGRPGPATTAPSGVRAGTSTRAATWAWGTASSVPDEPPARRRRASAAHRGRPRGALGGAGQGGGEEHLAGHHPGQPAGRQRRRCRSGPAGSAPSTRVDHSGTGATTAPWASSSRHSSVSPSPCAARGPRDGQAQQVGGGQGRPQLAVDPVVGRLDLGHPLGVDQRRRRRPRPPRRTAGCSSVKVKSISARSASAGARAGRKTGRVSSSS